MAQKTKQWAAIIVMIALFAMIAFVTNLCSPMATIIKAQGDISNVLAQIGNYGNFGAYLIMGLPAGMCIKKYGYKKTALIGLVVGIVGIGLQMCSGLFDAKENLGLVFGVYLAGALIAGACMCILNTVVNPMLNLLGGGGASGNQLIQIGGVFNSAAAVAVYIIMGALIGEAAKAEMADAMPALCAALAIFVIAFVVILFTKIDEPEQAADTESQMELVKGALSYRHFVFGILAICFYGAVEVGPPTYILQYLTADSPEIKAQKVAVIEDYNAKKVDAATAAKNFVAVTTNVDSILAQKDQLAELEAQKAQLLAEKNEKEAEKVGKQLNSIDKDIKATEKLVTDTQAKIEKEELTVDSVNKTTEGLGMAASYAGTLGAIYFLMMLAGRLFGGVVGGKIAPKTMIASVGAVSLVLLLIGIFLPPTMTISFPGVDWVNVSLVWGNIPVGIFLFLVVGLCASVMWGGIFNLAVEGLGKYTAIASGLFMCMVCGFAIMVAVQGFVADLTGSYLLSFLVPAACAAYILWYALLGSKPAKK